MLRAAAPNLDISHTALRHNNRCESMPAMQFDNILLPMKHTGENVVRIEAEALRALADRIGGPMAGAFDRALELMDACRGRVVVTGMGKSGIIARKIAATLSSIGTPALFMHPVDAIHGDLGMVVRGDVVLALSASGETEEILRLLATIKRLQVPLISMTGDRDLQFELGQPQPREALYTGRSRRYRTRLFSRQGSVLARPCPNCLDNDDARARRCAGSRLV